VFDLLHLHIELVVKVKWKWCQMDIVLVKCLQIFGCTLVGKPFAFELVMMALLCIPVDCVNIKLAG
jgi:hypothetical protein